MEKKKKSIAQTVDEVLDQTRQEHPDYYATFEAMFGRDYLIGLMEDMDVRIQQGISQAPTVPLSHAELAELDDEAFYEEIYDRVLSCEYNKLTPNAQLFCTVSLFDMEIQNGGLCQYLVNTNTEDIQKLSSALLQLGAKGHNELFLHFLSKNSIDLQHMEDFHSQDIQAYSRLENRYPFADFDDAYMQLPSLQELLTCFARQNIHDFVL